MENLKSLFCKSEDIKPPQITHDFKKGDLRMLVKGSNIYSIANQLNFKVDEEFIVEISSPLMENYVFVTPQYLCGAHWGSFPYLVPRGADEWIINVDDTIPFEMPKPMFLESYYVDKK
jgi:hypothetical protein